MSGIPVNHVSRFELSGCKLLVFRTFASETSFRLNDEAQALVWFLPRFPCFLVFFSFLGGFGDVGTKLPFICRRFFMWFVIHCTNRHNNATMHIKVCCCSQFLDGRARATEGTALLPSTRHSPLTAALRG